MLGTVMNEGSGASGLQGFGAQGSGLRVQGRRLARPRLARTNSGTSARIRTALARVAASHTHIDALLRERGDAWDLRFTRNDRVLITQAFADRAAACAAAETRRRELPRAGWTRTG